MMCGMNFIRSAEPLPSEIRAEMARKGFTQRDLSRLLNLSAATVSARMTGKTEFTVSEVRAIATWLNVPISRLLGEAA